MAVSRALVHFNLNYMYLRKYVFVNGFKCPKITRLTSHYLSSVNAPLDKDLGTDTKRLSKEMFILQRVNSEEVKKARDQL